MRITHVSTFDVQGGAARAAYRLHRGLLGVGQQSTMLSMCKASTDDTVHRLGPGAAAPDFGQWSLDRLQRHYVDARRTPISNTWFTLAYPGYDLTADPRILGSDVINLHWVARYQSPITLKRLLQLGRPVVWTLHDMWAFTGGCHYSSGCDGYEHDCWPCPQLRDDPDRLPSAVLSDKLATIEPPLTVVTPSKWLAACARRSRLFRAARIEVIPYSLETDTFAPVPKAEAKQRLGLDPDTVTLLGGADNGNERRKGFRVLADGLRICAAAPAFRELERQGAITLVWFGVPPDDLEALPLPTLALGQIASDERLRLIYSAADLYLLPSLEDNLPNTLLEAMSCGTPVIAFEVGGVPDVLEDGVTGRVVTPGDAGKLAEAILSCLRDDARRKMGEACRQVIEVNHAMDVQARRYVDLYQELCPRRPPAATRRAPNLDGEGPDPGTEEGPAWPARSGADLAGAGPAPLVDCAVGPAFEPILRRWSLGVAQADLEELERARAELHTLRPEVEHLREERERAQAELDALRPEVHRLRGRLGAMESTKFWKLRTLWFRIRRGIGLAGRE